MDTILRVNSEWRISSKELRERVHTQLGIQILEQYTHFYQQHSSVPFSKKNKETYLRYPPAEVEKVLTSIFS
jgi:hypothetical protein